MTAVHVAELTDLTPNPFVFAGRFDRPLRCAKDRCPPPKCQHTNGMQAYSAIGLSGCVGCVVRGNHVPQSGGDALNFNSGEYIITENLVENTGDGCMYRTC